MRGVPAGDRRDRRGAAPAPKASSSLCGVGLAAIAQRRTACASRSPTAATIAADLAVIGIGAVPVTGLAESAGLALDNGIAVDDFLQTSDPDIFAAGDCCSFPLAIYGGRRVRLESWRNAQDQGTLAARNMLGARRSRSRRCRGSGRISTI